MSTDTETADTPADPSPLATGPVHSRLVVLIGLLGIALVGTGFWMAGGTVGLVAAAGVGLSWYLLSSLYAIAFGHAALLWLVPAVALLPGLIISELGLFVVLVAPAMDTDNSRVYLVTTVVVLGGVLLAGLGSYWWSTDLRIAAGALLGTIAIGGYALYRYELVRLDLVEESDLP
ncbi:hypothetical protein [Halalkalicoccus salilacus]|uniref:hypothetical protein n=1 Tax=Halalkalicoccus salilacus TaxID=3117459 RepID=UPI00300F7926